MSKRPDPSTGGLTGAGPACLVNADSLSCESEFTELTTPWLVRGGEQPMPVRYETDPPIVVVTIDRPEVGNAVDRPTAGALADAFRRFDADDSLSVAVLTGAH